MCIRDRYKDYLQSINQSYFEKPSNVFKTFTSPDRRGHGSVLEPEGGVLWHRGGAFEQAGERVLDPMRGDLAFEEPGVRQRGDRGVQKVAGVADC